MRGRKNIFGTLFCEKNSSTVNCSPTCGARNNSYVYFSVPQRVFVRCEATRGAKQEERVFRPVRLFLHKDEKQFSRPATGAFLVKNDALDGKRGLFFIHFSAASESRRKMACSFPCFPG